MKKDDASTISNYILKEKWKEAKKLLEKLLLNEPKSYWAISNYAIVLYELRDYKMALVYSKKAFSISSTNPLVINYHAAILKVNNRIKEAIAIWEALLKKDINQIAFEDCQEGLKWTKSLLNDIRFNLSIAYKDIKDIKMAKKYLIKHLENRKSGQFSLYKKNEVLKYLASLGG